MPNTPVTWRNEFVANTTTSGTQYKPSVITLANGNILVTWASTDNTGAGAAAGVDIIGQIFDPLGNKVGTEFRVNNQFFADDETNGDLTAIPGGGYMLAYEDVSGGVTSLRYQLYDSNGNGLFLGTSPNIVTDSSTAEPNFSNVRLAASSSTSVLIIYEQTDGGTTTTVGRIYNPTTNAMGSQFSILATGGLNLVADVTVLTNGNYVVVSNNDSSDDGLYMRILSPTGANVLGFTAVGGTTANGFFDGEGAVTALTGGGFVVAWTNTDTNDTDIQFRVFDAAGTQVGSGDAGVGSATDNNNECKVVGLSDGSFVIVWDNDESGSTAFGVNCEHFSATGTSLGRFNFAATDADDIAVTLTQDGRIVAVWSDTAGDIRMEILDTRDAPNTSGGTYQVGTVGADVFTGNGSTFTEIHGADGNDVITEFGAISRYYGDAGEDLIRVVSLINSDVHDGGADSDTIDWTLSGVTNGIFDLQAGTATNGVSTEVMVNFENLIGTANADIIYGSSGVNVLTGGDGNDVLIGRGGADTLIGGNGIDTADYSTSGTGVIVNLTTGVNAGGDAAGDALFSVENITGSGLGDTLTGDTNANTIFGGSGQDVIRGGDNNDVIVGNSLIFVQEQDNLFGENGNDTIYGENVDVINGGTGSDVLIAINGFDFTLDMGATSIELAQMDFGNDTINASTQTVGVEISASGGNDTVTGSNFNDLVFAGVGNDIVNGGDGNDAIVGNEGIDQLNGGIGDDRIYFDGLDSFVFGGTGYDAGYIIASGGTGVTVNMGASSLEFIQDLAGNNDTILASTMTQGLTAAAGGGADTVDGSNFADEVYGEAGNDTLRGNGGNDKLLGGAGSDILSGGTGNDVLYGGAGDGVQDTFRFGETGAGNADVVFDFVHNIDKIDLSAFGVTFANVTITTSGSDAVVSVNGQIVCTVAGAAGNLTSSDFLFVSAAPPEPGVKDHGAEVMPILGHDGDGPVEVSPGVPGKSEGTVEVSPSVTDTDGHVDAGGGRIDGGPVGWTGFEHGGNDWTGLNGFDTTTPHHHADTDWMMV